MPQEIPVLSEAQKREISETLLRWANLHPSPDALMVEFPIRGTMMSARQFAEATTRPNSKEGQAVFKIFAIGIMPEEGEPLVTLAEILADYKNDANKWAVEKKAAQAKKLHGPHL